MTTTTVSKPIGAAPADAPTVSRPDRRPLVLGCAILAASVLVPDAAGSVYWTHAFQLIGLYIVAAIAQNLLLSDAGQASFGQGAVFGVSAYAVAIAVSAHDISLPVAMLLGIAAAVFLGLLFALPALRVQHFYLGFVTLSAAIVLPELGMAFSEYTNGLIGISLTFPQLHERSIAGLVSPLSLGIAVLSVIVLVLYHAFRQSVLGRRMRVAAASAEAAQSLGISPGAMRFAAFLLAALCTGAAGMLYPVVVGFVAPSSFGIDLSMLFFFAVIVGGRGTLLGPLVGVWVLYLLPNALLAELVHMRLIAYGAAALIVMLLFPDGIVGAFERWWQRRASSGQRMDLRVSNVIGTGRPAERGEASAATVGTAAIEVRGGRKSFGKVAAVDGVDLRVARGSIHGLVGANGSGKTSLLNVLSGFSRLNAGSLHIDGMDITTMAPHRVARLGLGRTFQTPRIFSGLSLWDNVQIGIDARADQGQGIDKAAVDALRRTLAHGSPDWVPHGQRRLVEVLRVALKGSHILLLDEPAAGLSPEERRDFAALLKQLRDDFATTIVLVEHDLDFVWGIADHITVLDAGRVVASGLPDAVAKDPAVAHMFIQGNHA
jgi:branched-chain amino acid transport system permease protein